MRPSGIRRAADSIALFQRLTTVLESHAGKIHCLHISVNGNFRMACRTHLRSSSFLPEETYYVITFDMFWLPLTYC